MKGIFTAGEKEITSGELGLHFLKAPAKFAVSRVKIESLVHIQDLKVMLLRFVVKHMTRSDPF